MNLSERIAFAKACRAAHARGHDVGPAHDGDSLVHAACRRCAAELRMLKRPFGSASTLSGSALTSECSGPPRALTTTEDDRRARPGERTAA